MATMESIKSAAAALESAIAEADTGVRALYAAEGDRSSGNGLVDFHAIAVRRLSEAALDLVTLINKGCHV